MRSYTISHDCVKMGVERNAAHKPDFWNLACCNSEIKCLCKSRYIRLQTDFIVSYKIFICFTSFSDISMKSTNFSIDINAFYKGHYYLHNPSNSLATCKILDLINLKVFVGYTINVIEKLTFNFINIENIVGKGENEGYQHFLLFQQCFQKTSFFESE